MAITTTYSVILDAARLEHEIEKAHELNRGGLSLYKGEPEEELSNVAPYLFSCSEKPQFINWVIDTGWGKAWGIFALSKAELIELLRHLRRFLMVKTEDGLQLYFRFYDPRVLRVFLPTCDIDQLREFFGPISKFVCEDEDPEFALIFSHDNTKLITQRIPAKEIFVTVLPFVKVLPFEKVEPLTEQENASTEENKTPETPKDDNPDKPKRFKFY